MARAKGTALIPLVSLLRTQRARAREILPSELQVYLEQDVLAARWYPEEHLLALLRGGAELVGGDREQILREFGRGSARHHLDGIYAHLRLEKDDPLAFPRRAFALWSSQHDTGELRVKLDGDSAATLRVEGYAAPSREMCWITWGYTEEVFRRAGVNDPRIDKRRCRSQGDALCEWSVHWS